MGVSQHPRLRTQSSARSRNVLSRGRNTSALLSKAGRGRLISFDMFCDHLCFDLSLLFKGGKETLHFYMLAIRD